MQSKFEAVLLHKGNHLSLAPFAHASGFNETYETIELVFHLIKDSIYKWNICWDLKVIGLLLGLQMGYTQYLNCRGDAGGRVPHRELACPHRDLGVPHRDLSAGWSDEKELILHLILAKNRFNFRQRPFFLVLIQFRRRNYVFFTKVLSHAKCVWWRLQKRPPMQNFTI